MTAPSDTAVLAIRGGAVAHLWPAADFGCSQRHGLATTAPSVTWAGPARRVTGIEPALSAWEAPAGLQGDQDLDGFAQVAGRDRRYARPTARSGTGVARPLHSEDRSPGGRPTAPDRDAWPVSTSGRLRSHPPERVERWRRRRPLLKGGRGAGHTTTVPEQAARLVRVPLARVAAGGETVPRALHRAIVRPTARAG
jgi:hypothetical protein